MKFTAIFFIFIFFVSNNISFAHGGGLDSSGCHTMTSNNTRHCHNDNESNNNDDDEDLFVLVAGIGIGLYVIYRLNKTNYSINLKDKETISLSYQRNF